jgi:uncharacterized membrane protein
MIVLYKILLVLHIFFGTIWMGGYLFLYLIFYPTILIEKKTDFLIFKNKIQTKVKKILNTSGILAVFLGFLNLIKYYTMNFEQFLYSFQFAQSLISIFIVLLMGLIGKLISHKLIDFDKNDKNNLNSNLKKFYYAGILISIFYFLLLYVMVGYRT